MARTKRLTKAEYEKAKKKLELKNKIADETIKQLLQEKEQMKAIIEYKQIIYHSEITKGFNDDEKDFIWTKIANAWLKHNGMQPHNSLYNTSNILMINLSNNEVLMEFKTCTDCAKYIHDRKNGERTIQGYYNGIRKCLLGIATSAYGYGWEYAEDYEE